ncbi:glutathione peroxidase [Ornithinibacillus scapharcae]|uniref:glutathione peroxidase n=1 Tax=Ornithinibacillus scapharcae TaxID=1147159 RepID=UPI000225BF29|nr:glutathione peroxidase [Ornithinibacillus scapharcae]
MSIYDISAETLQGETKSFSDYKGKVLVIVNTASKCGFAPQFDGLQKIYETYQDKGLEVLGFPCDQFANQEPGTSEDIASFCQKNYGVSFQMFDKIDVKGPNAHPLFQLLTKEVKGLLSEDIKWNFTKFLVDQTGKVVKRYAPQTAPEKMIKDIEKLLS